MTLNPCFSLDALNSEQKLSVKKTLTEQVRNRSTGRSTDLGFEIYRSGRVEKILAGSISAPAWGQTPVCDIFELHRFALHNTKIRHLLNKKFLMFGSNHSLNKIRVVRQKITPPLIKNFGQIYGRI